MQIGDFAKLCNTKISVLRHYDRVGLLKPAYTDMLTGYRYYSEKQKHSFKKISVLKEAGFSLPIIKKMLEFDNCEDKILSFFENRQAEITQMLNNLEEAKSIMLGESNMDKSENILRLEENINLPFENDPEVIGKWAVIGVYSSMTDYINGNNSNSDFYGESVKEIYFLPGGERYWVYGWTKGKLLIDEYISHYVEDYRTEDIDGEKYMFIDHKSYQYIVSGKTELLVLKKLDSKEYTPSEIARKDNIDLPFINDSAVIGKWRTCGFLLDKSEFTTCEESIDALYWKSVEFFENGNCTSVYEDDIISGEDKQTWTKNYILRKYNNCACEYEIRNVDGNDYLIIEWKSGDYRYGCFDTNYYVFTRE